MDGDFAAGEERPLGRTVAAVALTAHNRASLNAAAEQETRSMNIRPPRIGPQPWDIVRNKLDQSLPFANMRDTPYYRDAVWE